MTELDRLNAEISALRELQTLEREQELESRAALQYKLRQKEIELDDLEAVNCMLRTRIATLENMYVEVRRSLDDLRSELAKADKEAKSMFRLPFSRRDG